jgi:uncharacterized protein YndB with AHSA1/START domain
LTLRESICASPERLFELWTRPEHLLQWFGPEGSTCVGPEVDLRVGGRYRIGNRFADGKLVWIVGVFEEIDRPVKLIYSWGIEPAESAERVTVSFVPQGSETEVIVVHERICDQPQRDGHEKGWKACLKSLAAYASKVG